MRVLSKSFVLFSALAMLAACGPATEVETPADPDPNGSATISSLGAFDGVLGTKEVMISYTIARDIRGVELFCDDALEPAASADGGVTTVMWDTTRCNDGVVGLWLRVIDTDGNNYDSARTPVVVVNSGRVVNLQEGSYASMSIPAGYDGTQEVDTKHHWDNPAGIRRIVGIGNWQVPEGDSPWQIEVQVGCGICPHSGTSWGQPVSSDQGQIMIDVRASEINQDSFDAILSFIHFRPLNAYDHTGCSLPYQAAVYLFDNE